MGKRSGKPTDKSPETDSAATEPRCLEFTRQGLKNSQQVTGFFAALISDLAEQRVTANIANAMCNAGRKLLKTVELEIRYGQQVPGKSRRLLAIAVDQELEVASDHRVLAKGGVTTP